MITTLILTLLAVFLTGYLLQTTVKPKKYPPGPRWLPFVGSSNVVQRLIKVHGSQWKAFSHLAKEYSTSVLGLKLGGELVVVVYGQRLIRQAFTDAEYEGRPNSFFIRLRCFGKRMGITAADGPLWRIHRQFTVTQLKNVGFGKTAMQEEIRNELGKIVQFIQNTNKPISPKNILATSVMNVLWKYVAGESIATDRLSLLLELLSARSKAFSMAGGMLNQFPWCRFFFPEASGYSLITRINGQISDFIEDAIKRHKSSSTKGNDFIYSFLQQMEEDKDNVFTEQQLKVICLDMFIAGSQTTSNLLEFALLAALRHQQIQDKIYEEIHRVIGDDTPCWMDNSKLVYTSAFLLEVQRCFTIVPLNGPRRLLKDSFLDGYFIPKDTTVLMSVGDLNFNPEIYSDPQEFKPERFIDEHGDLKIPEHLYTFGMGRRRCPGDALARSFIFITFVGLLQKFRIQCVNGVLPSDEPVIGLISAPRPYSAVFVKRQ